MAIEEKRLVTKRIKIVYSDGLSISITSRGYSYTDLIEKRNDKLEENYETPKEINENFTTETIITNLRRNSYVVDDTLYSDYKNNKEIEQICERIITSFPQNVKIKLSEPPLLIEDKKIDINKDKGILLPYITNIESDENYPFSYSGIRLQENASYFIVVEDNNNRNFRIEFPGATIKDYVSPYGKNNGWTINFGNQLFYGNITIVDKNKDDASYYLPILVYPRKLDVKEVEIIIKQILEWHAELLYDLEPTGLTIIPGEYAKKTPIQRLKYIRSLFKKRKLKGILNSIIENPDKKLIKEELLKEIQDVETPCCHLLPDLVMESSALIRNNANPHFWTNNKTKGYSFIKAYEEVSQVTHDTYPNRFVKFFLKLLKKELNTIEEELSSKSVDLLQNYYEWLKNKVDPEYKLSDMKRDVSRILNHDFFREVSDIKFFSAPSQTLLKEYRYQQIFSAYLDMIKGVMLSDKLDELLQDPICNMPELYEYWCFLKLSKILNDKNELNKKIINIKPHFKDESLIGKTLGCGYEIQYEDNINLIYNIYYNNKEKENHFYSYSVPLRPDFTLTINGKIILFDAKYRISWLEEIEKLEKNSEKEVEELTKKERIGSFVVGDLYKMHTYREALLDSLKLRPAWVVALYPGDNSKLFPESIENRQKLENEIKSLKIFLDKLINNDICDSGVGVIPLKPQTNNAK